MLGRPGIFEYDAASNLTRRTDRNGRVIEYDYDNLYRLIAGDGKRDRSHRSIFQAYVAACHSRFAPALAAKRYSAKMSRKVEASP
ncbi:MAG: RHS repeat protein [Planctomycetia bacterium]|nr:RHS repeat protein [Planctomycetia bacterium]